MLKRYHRRATSDKPNIANEQYLIIAASQQEMAGEPCQDPCQLQSDGTTTA